MSHLNNNYDLHTPGGENINHDPLTQQQQHQHHGVQPYPFEPQQQSTLHPYGGHTNGHSEQADQLADNGVEKPRWKGNRLRKACDSCSIRKVRVSFGHLPIEAQETYANGELQCD